MSSAGAVTSRGATCEVLVVAGIGLVLLPSWMELSQPPIKQIPIPHASRENSLTNIEYGLNYFIIPWGAMLLALPFIFTKGLKERRLLPLFLGFWVVLIFAMGGTTPLPKLVLGRLFDIVTFERYTFWANLLALPIVGLLAVTLIDRYGRKAMVGLGTLAALTMAVAVSWPVFHVTHRPRFSSSDQGS